MNYYTSANTADGFCDFTGENIFDTKYKILFKCRNKHIRNLVLHNIDGDKIMCCGSDSLVTGIVNDEKTILSSCKNPDIVVDADEYFGVSDYDEAEFYYRHMFSCYRQAKEIHDEWEKIYISNMDFQRLDKYCNRFIDAFLVLHSKKGNGRLLKGFFGTSTVNGPVNFIDNITKNVNKRYFIKGRPGTGKSTFLKKLSKALLDNGFDIEEYNCSFDKNSLDMVVCRELSVCVFDSTPPHEKFPQMENDSILDFYNESGLSGIDEKYAKKLLLVKTAYEKKIGEGMDYFKKAWALENEAELKMLSSVCEDDFKFIRGKFCF